MRIGVLGINHKLADLKLREKLAKTCHQHFALGQCKHNDHYYVLLSTCNRTEVYFYSFDLAEAHSYLLALLRQEISEDFDQKLYSYFGYDCFLHLSRVTAGLDSAIVVETEIQGQVKTAYEHAMQFTKLPYEMHYLFQNSLFVGKKARSVLPVTPGLPDLEHSIFQAGLQHFDKPQQIRILCVGASDINKKVISFLKAKKFEDITLCNRTHCHAQSLAEQENLSYLDWNDMGRWHEFDWIIFGTKSPSYLISPGYLPHNLSPKLIMDLCVPRNVDPLISKDNRITLLNIDQLMQTLKGRRNTLLKALHQAEKMVADTAKQKIATFNLKQRHRRGIQTG